MARAFAYYLVSSVTIPLEDVYNGGLGGQPEVLGNLSLRYTAISHVTDGFVPFLRSGMFSPGRRGSVGRWRDTYVWTLRGSNHPGTLTPRTYVHVTHQRIKYNSVTG